ncbi:MAG: UDP-N-acetylmuramoyl-tripeptide--D-alanyl-D-alanine ligase [Nitrospirota bacterium]|nr:UDP-N-acetylmuramoyl-tripeptide--D-alanyl-D-alanine ligase [Nitrospirota bacterium]
MTGAGAVRQGMSMDMDVNILAVLAERMDTMEIKGVSIDSRTIGKGELFIAIRGDRFDGHDFVEEVLRKGACGALVERSALETGHPGLGGRPDIYPVEDTLRSLQELSLMHRNRFTIPLVAVTGSNGKTTTKEMLAAILLHQGPVLKNEGNLNNHIGVPLTLLKLGPAHRAAVIELGMSNFGEIELLTRLARPDVGVITNIGPAHLEFLKSTDGVARAKGELLETMRSDGTAVLNADDQYFDALRTRFRGRTISFGIDRPADVRASDLRQTVAGTEFALHAGGRSFPVRLAAAGRHNVSNALAAAAAAVALGMTPETVQAGLEKFRPVTMRSEVREVRGISVIADCYNANPASMAAAITLLASLRRQGGLAIAVLGDMLELGEGGAAAHQAVGGAAAAAGLDLLIVLGAQQQQVFGGARSGGMAADRMLPADSAERAAALLRERARPGDTVLIKGSRGMKMEKVLEAF